MKSVAVLPDADTNIFSLIFIGLSTGILNGFAGVGGAFVVKPTLIIFGSPGNLAVGSPLA